MSLGVGDDETHLGTFVSHRLRTSHLDIGERREPTGGDRSTVSAGHDAAEERGCECARFAGDGHTVGNRGVVDGQILRRRRVVEDVVLRVATVEGKFIAVLETFAAALTQYLHIDTAFVELDELAAAEVGLVAILHELFF